MSPSQRYWDGDEHDELDRRRLRQGVLHVRLPTVRSPARQQNPERLLLYGIRMVPFHAALHCGEFERPGGDNRRLHDRGHRVSGDHPRRPLHAVQDARRGHPGEGERYAPAVKENAHRFLHDGLPAGQRRDARSAR